ncbi:MAG: hypothetical protein J6U54_21480 [Clostridiales bacterium]|nr:hypothetical protein [Clostridiales bacterium]
MKKNTKIGLGVAAASVISLAVAFPVFADIKPNDIIKSGKIVTEETVEETEAQIEETQAEEAQIEETTVEETVVDETQVEEDEFDELLKEDSIKKPDFENSPNFCRMSYLAHDEYFMEADPADYEDPELRRLAEEYASKGYFLEDSEYCATHYASGIGGMEYVFCNGFEVTDSKEGNNTFFIAVLKATPEEFEWFMSSLGFEVTYDGDVAVIEAGDEYNDLTYTYDRGTEIFIYKVEFLTTEAIG